MAMGSNVPPWPTRFWAEARLMRRTTSIEVIPSGLSTFRILSMALVLVSRIALRDPP